MGKDVDGEIDELRAKLNDLMGADYKSSYDEVLHISIKLDELIHLVQAKS